MFTINNNRKNVICECLGKKFINYCLATTPLLNNIIFYHLFEMTILINNTKFETVAMHLVNLPLRDSNSITNGKVSCKQLWLKDKEKLLIH